MQLIKGTYSKEDALEIVQQIIQVKIKFHEEKIALSDSEEDIKMREKRIKDLQNDLSSFRKAIYAHSGSINMNSLVNLNKSESSSHDFKLINGNFDFEDAREILMTAYHSKINFHKLKAWSKSERGEAGSELHMARALELQMEIQSIKELLNANLKNGMKVHITCAVKLEFESQEEMNVPKQEIVHSH